MISPNHNSNTMKNRFLRYIAAGVSNTIFGYTIFSMLCYFGLYTWQCLFIAQGCGVIFNFITLGNAFKKLFISNFPRFFIWYLFVICINIVALDVLSDVYTNVLTAQALLTVPLGILSYFALPRFVFKTLTS